MLTTYVSGLNVNLSLNQDVSPAIVALVTALGFLVCVGGLAWSFVLDTRYTGPYTLVRASMKQKLGWAAKITFWQTLTIPILGIVIPLMVPSFATWPVFTLTCLGAWAVLFPIGALVRRDRMDWILKGYIRAQRIVQTGTASPRVPHRQFDEMRQRMNGEIGRFLEEGYGED